MSGVWVLWIHGFLVVRLSLHRLGIIIYSLLYVEKISITLNLFSDFGRLLAGIGRDNCHTGLKNQNATKKLARRVDPLSQLLIRKRISKIFMPETTHHPPPWMKPQNKLRRPVAT